MIIRVLRWLLYTLCLSVFPIGAAAIARIVLKTSHSMGDLLGSGELLMICCAVSAAAIGELVSTKPKYPYAKLIFVSGGLFLVALTLVGYTVIVVAILKQLPYDENLVAKVSVYIFIVSGVCSSVCIGLAHEQ